MKVDAFGKEFFHNPVGPQRRGAAYDLSVSSWVGLQAKWALDPIQAQDSSKASFNCVLS